jgi:hypothetical protein
MRRFVVALVAVLLPSLVSAAPKGLPDQPSKENILGWINTYRHNPDPDRVPAAVRGMSRLGLITDPEGSGVYIGFLAGVIAANPDRADMLIGKMFPLSPEHHWAIVRAIAYSGHPDWRMLMQRVADRMPGRSVMMDRHLAGKLPRLDEAPIEKDETWGEKMRSQFTLAKYVSKPAPDTKLALTPDLLDTLWGYYFATGSDQRQRDQASVTSRHGLPRHRIAFSRADIGILSMIPKSGYRFSEKIMREKESCDG